MNGHQCDDAGASAVRSASSMSQIPVPQGRSKLSASVATSSSSMPKRVAVGLPRSATSTSNVVRNNNSNNNMQRGKGKNAPSLTVPRAPMASVILNQSGSLDEMTAIDAPLRKVTNAANGASRSTNRRRVSGGQRGSGSSRRSGGTAKSPLDEGRMNAIESKITSMQDLFDMERRRTEELLIREQCERQVQEDRVRQLEQDLLEQRRMAGQNGNGASSWLNEEEIRQLKQKFEQERVELQLQLEKEQMTVSKLKVSMYAKSEVVLGH